MFSKSTEYALRAAIFIARHGSEAHKVSVPMIADGIGAPRSFTAKILQHLTKKNTGIITSVSGPTGGLYISEEAKNLPIITILELMGEKNVIENCIMGLPKCSDTNPCSLHHQYKQIRPEIIKMFQEQTIGELAQANNIVK